MIKRGDLTMCVADWLKDNQDWIKVIDSTHQVINQLQAIICFGSRVTMAANEKSDYDLLLIVERQYSFLEQRKINNLLQETSQHKIHATILTSAAFEAGMRMSPYVNMVYKTGVVVEGATLVTRHFRPLARLGILNELGNIRTELETYDEERKSNPDYDYAKSGSLLKAYRSSLTLKYLLTTNPTPLEMTKAIRKMREKANFQIVGLIKELINELDKLIIGVEENESDRELEARLCG